MTRTPRRRLRRTSQAITDRPHLDVGCGGALEHRHLTRVLSAVVAASLAVAVLAASSCGGDLEARDAAPATASSPSSSESPATAPTSTTTTVAPSPDEVEIRALVDRFWTRYLEALSIPDPANPALLALVADNAEIRVTNRLLHLEQLTEHVVAPVPSVARRSVITVTFDSIDQATVRQCVVDDLRVEDIESQLLIDGDVVTAEYTTTVARAAEGWRITEHVASEWLEDVRDCSLFT